MASAASTAILVVVAPFTFKWPLSCVYLIRLALISDVPIDITMITFRRQYARLEPPPPEILKAGPARVDSYVMEQA
jgi:hypothetical protein